MLIFNYRFVQIVVTAQFSAQSGVMSFVFTFVLAHPLVFSFAYVVTYCTGLLLTFVLLQLNFINENHNATELAVHLSFRGLGA